MADNGQNVVATPYPFYATGGNDSDEVFKAALITQGDASTQRNQDSQFAALRDQQLNRDVVDNQRAVENAKFELATAQKDSEIRSVDRFAEIKSELAALREKMDGNAIAQLRVDLAETKAEGRAAKQESLLAAILAKLPV
jgi:hypothetical protein